VSLACFLVAATCYEQPVLGAHLGSPWLLGLLRCKPWSRSILLARCSTPLLAPTALASSTSPTQQDRKCFPISFPRKCLAVPIAIDATHVGNVHRIPSSLLIFFSKNHNKNHLQIRRRLSMNDPSIKAASYKKFMHALLDPNGYSQQAI
jgi:hypothetical protein